jgi:hypothetical protein
MPIDLREPLSGYVIMDGILTAEAAQQLREEWARIVSEASGVPNNLFGAYINEDGEAL